MRPAPALPSIRSSLRACLLAAVLALPAAPLAAQLPLRVASLGTCPTASGTPVRDCRIAYRTAGRLNARRDNAVLLPTWYAGRSEDMTFLLGSGGWVDTTRYFAILLDGLGFGVGSSPSTSREQPGAAFPRLTFDDMVDAQLRLVTEHLGIRRLHAVVGWSMGGTQALVWRHRHPTRVARVVSVAGPPRMDAVGTYWIRTMLAMLDDARRLGTPRDTMALRFGALWHLVGMTPARENATVTPAGIDTMLAREIHAEWLRLDPEDNRLTLEAMARLDLVRAARDERSAPRTEAPRWMSPSGPRTLLVYVPDDHLTTAEAFRDYAVAAPVDLVAHRSACGHMAPVCDTAGIGGPVRRFLDDAP